MVWLLATVFYVSGCTPESSGSGSGVTAGSTPVNPKSLDNTPLKLVTHDKRELIFSKARVREPLPGRDKTVGYFTLINNLDRDIRILGAVSASVRAIEFHVNYEQDNMVRMRRLSDIQLSPGEQVDFEPGGKHLMLFGVKKGVSNLEIEFVDEDGVKYKQSFDTFSLNQG